MCVFVCGYWIGICVMCSLLLTGHTQTATLCGKGISGLIDGLPTINSISRPERQETSGIVALHQRRTHDLLRDNVGLCAKNFSTDFGTLSNKVSRKISC